MRAKITGIKEHRSKWGGIFWHVYFKSDQGESWLTNVFPTFKGKPVRNFARWRKILALWADRYTLRGREIWLTDLNPKDRKKHLIDADSLFSLKLI